MPPKPKLHKSKGKSEQSFTRKSTATLVDSNDNSQDSGTSDPHSQEQFEVELCWCVQQLQKVLSSSKLNPRQVQENTKALNTLMSNSSSFIKKRQIMRLTFGDYRAKMMEEDTKLSKALNLKISTTSPSKKSKFVKKAMYPSGSSENFKFNFNVNVQDKNLSENVCEDEVNTKNIANSKPFHFSNSGNSFRFNFTVDEN